MSYIEFDPTNPEQYKNFTPASQRKWNRIIKGLAIVGLVCLVIYLANQESETRKEEDIFVS